MPELEPAAAAAAAADESQDELGASDEVITYKDEGETGVTELQTSDLSDIKSSLVNESHPGGGQQMDDPSQKDGVAASEAAKNEGMKECDSERLMEYNNAMRYYGANAAAAAAAAANFPALSAASKISFPQGFPALSAQAMYTLANQEFNSAAALDIDPKTGIPRGRPEMYQQAAGGHFPGYPDFSLQQWQNQGMFPNAGGMPHGGGYPGIPGMAARGGFPSPFVYPGVLPTMGGGDDKRVDQMNRMEERKNKPYVKKPLNAFMLFMKENREKVMQESTLKESAAINQILGRKWHQLERTEQAKYYDMARRERAIHLKLYPGWSARDNYAMGKSRKKRKRANTGGGSANTTGGSAVGVGQTVQHMKGGGGSISDCYSDDSESAAKKCRARFGMEQQEAWCKHCRRKKKCQYMIKTEDGYQVAMNPMDGEDHCSESEECLAAERAEQAAAAAHFNNNLQHISPNSDPGTSFVKSELSPQEVSEAEKHLMGSITDPGVFNGNIAGGHFTSSNGGFFGGNQYNPRNCGNLPFSAAPPHAQFGSAASSIFPTIQQYGSSMNEMTPPRSTTPNQVQMAS